MGQSGQNPLRMRRIIAVLRFLRKETDSEHPVSMHDIREFLAGQEMEANKKTSHKLIKDLALALNYDEDEHELPWDQCRVCYDAISPDGEETENGYDMINHLYYRQEFSEKEIDRLQEALLFHPTLEQEQADKLSQKVERLLASRFHVNKTGMVMSTHHTLAGTKTELYKNLSILQKAIYENKKVRYWFRQYDCQKELKLKRREKDVVSPYYIVAYRDFYYLLGVGEGYKTLSIWRIDLMFDLEVTKQRAMSKHETNAPEHWNNNFIYQHPYMAFDDPRKMILRIRRKERDDQISYTFIHDWFGPTFRYIKTEDKPPYGDIVEVFCSPWAMANWALQYSDRVEVLEPKEVRDEIAGKVRGLEKMYLEN